MFFGNDSDKYLAAGSTPDGRNVTIERYGGGFVLKSDGSTPQYSGDLNYLRREFDKQVPPDHHFH